MECPRFGWEDVFIDFWVKTTISCNLKTIWKAFLQTDMEFPERRLECQLEDHVLYGELDQNQGIPWCFAP